MELEKVMNEMIENREIGESDGIGESDESDDRESRNWRRQ